MRRSGPTHVCRGCLVRYRGDAPPPSWAQLPAGPAEAGGWLCQDCAELLRRAQGEYQVVQREIEALNREPGADDYRRRESDLLQRGIRALTRIRELTGRRLQIRPARELETR